MLNYTYWLWENALNDAFCKYIIDDADWEKSTKGKYASKDGFIDDPKTRDTDVLFYTWDHPLSCVLNTYIMQANSAAGWMYDISEFQAVQLGRYTEGGHYDWHKDIGVPNENGLQRKLTAVLLLNEQPEYEGGLLELKDHDDPSPMTKKGSVIVFPSFLDHRVTPVTKGARFTAVCWAAGPAFR